MKIAILGQQGNWHIAALQAALARRGMEAPCFPIAQLTARVTDRPRLLATMPQPTSGVGSSRSTPATASGVAATAPRAVDGVGRAATASRRLGGVRQHRHAAETQQAPSRGGSHAAGTAQATAGPTDPLEDYDVVLVRGIPGGSLEQIIFRVDMLHRLENASVRVINSPLAIERTVDKYYTSTLLEDAGLPTPRTVVTEQFDQALAAFHELGGDVVIKPLFGSEGRGMVRVSDPDTAYRALRALELGRYVYYLQQFVPHGCEDIRVFVVDQQVVAAMVRQGQTWKTNIAQGAKAVPLAPDASLSTIARQAVHAVGASYAGVDILVTEGGAYTVIEVNGIPGWQGLQEVTPVDIADQLAEYALRMRR